MGNLSLSAPLYDRQKDADGRIFYWKPEGRRFRGVGHAFASPWLFVAWAATLGRACKNWAPEMVEVQDYMPVFNIYRPRTAQDHDRAYSANPLPVCPTPPPTPYRPTSNPGTR